MMMMMSETKREVAQYVQYQVAIIRICGRVNRHIPVQHVKERFSVNLQRLIRTEDHAYSRSLQESGLGG